MNDNNVGTFPLRAAGSRERLAPTADVIRSLQEQVRFFRSQLEDRYRPQNILGNSHAMRDVYERIRQAGEADSPVLILGEHGVGKDLVASTVHYAGRRSDQPFVKIHCAVSTEGWIEAEVFGREASPGTATGAADGGHGRVQSGGTLYLDEIGGFSPPLQGRLLQWLVQRGSGPVGQNGSDSRLILASCLDLGLATAAGRFNPALHELIRSHEIRLPPLRDRREDILQLADYFVGRFARKYGKGVRRISAAAAEMLLNYHWPMNVRELEDCIEQAVLRTEDDAIHAHHLSAAVQAPPEAGAGACDLVRHVEIVEKDLILEAMKRARGNARLAARDLGVTPRIVRYKIEKLRIDTRLFKRTTSKL